MGILSEQNILGNPTLSLATRPGSDESAADYAFNAPMVYQMAEGNFINPSFTSPASYSIDKVVGEVTKNNDAGEQTGVDGESITFPEAATQYGPAAGNKLADSQQTNLGAAAEVIAGNADPTENVTTESSMSATESKRNKTVVAGTDTAVASGGATPSYSENHNYSINKSDGGFNGGGDMAESHARQAAAAESDGGGQPDQRNNGPSSAGDTTQPVVDVDKPGLQNLMPDDGAPGAGAAGSSNSQLSRGS